jgi:tetratricopeptide (TPR) repeat protein
MRQAVEPFARVRQLAPDNLPVRLWLAQLYLFNRLPAPALEALQDPLIHPARFGLNATNATELNVLAAAGHFQKKEIPQGVDLLEREISRHPDDLNLLTSTAQAYFMHGLYTNVLDLINRRLAQTPDDPQWLFGKGYAFLQLSNYNQAIITLTRVLDVSTNDPTARFNRALAYLQSDRLNDARADYTALQSTYTNSFQIAFGLAEVAWRQHATNEAIRNYELYLINAPTNSAEFQTVRERLTQLRGK